MRKMIYRYTKLPYILAIIFGLIVPFIPKMEPFPVPLALIYLFCGGIFGFFWPKESWRWGLWIVGPVLFFLALSIIFTGQLEIFFKKDLPVLLLAIGSACLGGFILAWYNQKIR